MPANTVSRRNVYRFIFIYCKCRRTARRLAQIRFCAFDSDDDSRNWRAFDNDYKIRKNVPRRANSSPPVAPEKRDRDFAKREFQSRFAGFDADGFSRQELDYKLVNRRNGQEIELRRLSPKSVSRRNSLSKITFPVRNFDVTEIAKYWLMVGGLNPQTDYSEYSLIIEKPTSTKSVFYILAIILFGAVTVLGFVLTIFLLNAG